MLTRLLGSVVLLVTFFCFFGSCDTWPFRLGLLIIVLLEDSIAWGGSVHALKCINDIDDIDIIYTV